MKARYKNILSHSIGMSLSAIEIYNKPAFSCREAVFSVLICSAWEALLKAKIVKDTKRIQSIYVLDGTRYKRNRNGEHLTIELRKCIETVSLPVVVS